MAYPTINSVNVNTIDGSGTIVPVPSFILHINGNPVTTPYTFTQNQNTIEVWNDDQTLYFSGCFNVEDESLVNGSSSFTLNILLVPYALDAEQANIILTAIGNIFNNYAHIITYPCDNRLGLFIGISTPGCNELCNRDQPFDNHLCCNFDYLKLYDPINISIRYYYKVCIPIEQEGCCGNQEVVNTYIEGGPYPIDIEGEIYYQSPPNVINYLDCNYINPVINTLDYNKFENCIGGCTGCDCEERLNCKCIPQNTQIRLVTEYNLSSLPGTLTIEYSHDKGITWTNLNTINITTNSGQQIDTILFQYEGEYIIRTTLTDDCGRTCIYNNTVVVGERIRISRENCPAKFKIQLFYPTIYYDRFKFYFNIYDITDDKLLNPITLNAKKVDDINYEFVIGKQGIWLLEIVEKFYNKDTLEETTIDKKYFLIFDFCEYVKCYIDLYNQRYNEEACVDCNDNKITDLLLKIGEFQMLFDQINILIDILKRKTSNTFRWNNNDIDIINAGKDLQFYIDRLNSLCFTEPQTNCCNG